MAGIQKHWKDPKLNDANNEKLSHWVVFQIIHNRSKLMQAITETEVKKEEGARKRWKYNSVIITLLDISTYSYNTYCILWYQNMGENSIRKCIANNRLIPYSHILINITYKTIFISLWLNKERNAWLQLNVTYVQNTIRWEARKLLPYSNYKQSN